MSTKIKVSKASKVKIPLETEENLIIKEPTIHDKYRKYINSAKEGYVHGFEYSYAIEVLRYVENKTNHKIGLSMSCGNCIIELLKVFSNLEDK